MGTPHAIQSSADMSVLAPDVAKKNCARRCRRKATGIRPSVAPRPAPAMAGRITAAPKIVMAAALTDVTKQLQPLVAPLGGEPPARPLPFLF